MLLRLGPDGALALDERAHDALAVSLLALNERDL
jgi:hypothetical protein